MADTPISGMTAASALSGTEVLAGLQSGANRKISVAQIKALLDSYYQAADSELTALAALASAADTVPYFAGSGTASLAAFTAAARTLLAAADAAGQRTALALGTAAVLPIDTDATLAANSDTRIATQRAVKAYADQLIASADAMIFKGVIDCSANPNYPAADRGWTYRVSVAGKIGGASGVNVEVGDGMTCMTDGTVAGDQAAVGAAWAVWQGNIDGAVIGPDSATDGALALFSGASGKRIGNTGPLVSALAQLAIANVFTKGQAVTPVALTDAASIATDANLGNSFTVTLGGNRTLANPTNLRDGQVLNWKIKQDATGSRTLVAYGPLFKWPGGTAPTLSAAANARDGITAKYWADEGILDCAYRLDVK